MSSQKHQTDKARQERRRLNGCCIKCDDKVKENLVLCEYHWTVQRQQRVEALSLNFCGTCYRREAVAGKRSCEKCIKRSTRRSAAKKLKRQLQKQNVQSNNQHFEAKTPST